MFTPRLDLGRPIAKHPLNDGLVSRWQAIPQGPYMGSGYLYDLAGKNDGTLTNGLTWSGPLGRPGGFGSITTDGVDDYIDLAGTTRLGTLLGSGLTLGISFWLKSEDGSPFYVFGCGFSGADVFNVYWESGYFEWQVRDQFTATCLATGSRPSQATDGLWHHWFFTCAASVAPKVYCDGEPLSFSESTASQTWSALSGNIYLAARNLGNSSAQSPGAGSFDNFRIVAKPSIGTDYARQLMLAEMSQYDPTLNWIKPRKYFFVDGGADPAEGSGSISAVALLAGTGHIATSGSGTVNAVGVLAGVGYVTTSGTGAVAAVGTLAGSGYVVTSGSGSVQAVGLLAGTGYIATSGSGSIAAVAILVGVGAATDAAEGSGSISAVATLVGVGYRVSEGTGAPTAVATLAGTGYRESVGTGQVVGVAILVGAGEGEAATVVAGRPTLTWELISQPLYFQSQARQPHYELEANNLPLWSDE